MTTKPKTADGYLKERTDDCKLVLGLVLRAFGTLKPNVRLVGGLVPTFLTPEAPPDVPPHAGTSDVDIVLDVQILADRGTYAKLRKQLKEAGFTPFLDEAGRPSSWRWEYRISDHRTVVVEFLQATENPDSAGRLVAVDGEDISALQVLHADVAIDWFEECDIPVQLPGDGGISIDKIRFADATAYVVLKALAFDDRHENKDAADLLHVLRYAGELEDQAARFRARRAEGRHSAALDETLAILRKRFCTSDAAEGHLLDGPAACAAFHRYAEGDPEEATLYRREVSAIVSYFVELASQI